MTGCMRSQIKILIDGTREMSQTESQNPIKVISHEILKLAHPVSRITLTELRTSLICSTSQSDIRHFC